MSLSVLIVDDEKVFRDYIRQMHFWEEGLFTLKGEAKNAMEAMEYLTRHSIDIVLLDVSMPGKNGVELSAMIANKYPAVVMLAISSYDDYDFVREILKNGAYDYILKHRLTSDLLLAALNSIRMRVENTSSWDVKKQLRQKAHYWLENGGSSPFIQNNSRKAVTIAEVAQVEAFSTGVKDSLIIGILRMLETHSDEEVDVLALFSPSNRFIVITSFYTAISEDYIQKRIAYNNMLSQNSINKVYHLSFKAHICPLLFDDNAIRSYILHWLREGNNQKEENVLALSLTINQQKRLFAAIESRSSDVAILLIQDIYEKIPEMNYGLLMMITKELLDIIEKVSAEYQLSLDFLPDGTRLFEYIKAKSTKELAAIISGLYTQVFREITNNDKNQKQYSDVVLRAMEYFQKNYNRPIGLSDAAKAIGINSSYLSRIFHKEVGTTVVNYVNQVRIEVVKELLHSNLPLKEIAYQCGFKNYTYFLQTFKKYIGKTPKEYVTENKIM
jgi:YesN/AraC family two-component response regulator